MTMQERIKQIRKDNNLSQASFGEKIGISSSQIACYENGIRDITERSINSICKEFNVNEEWLKNGTGEVYSLPIENERLVKALAEIAKSENEKLKTIVEKMLELDGRYIDIVYDLINTVLEDQKK